MPTEGEIAPLRVLALKVVGQAVRDLQAPKYAREARRFLMVDLWRGNNLWAALLENHLDKKRVLRAAARRQSARAAAIALFCVAAAACAAVSPLPAAAPRIEAPAAKGRPSCPTGMKARPIVTPTGAITWMCV